MGGPNRLLDRIPSHKARARPKEAAATQKSESTRGRLAERSVRSVIEDFLRAKLPVSAVRSYAEAAADPHVRERGMLQELELEDGTTVPIVAPAAKFSRTPARIRAAAPILDQDNEKILSELGLTGDAMAELRADGVI